MKLFNAVIVFAAALSGTTAVQIRAPTNYEERKLQDEVGSMPSDAIEAAESLYGVDFLEDINDFKCELTGGLLGDKLDALCDFAFSTLDDCLRRRLDTVGRRLADDDDDHTDDPVPPSDLLCEELCRETVPFFWDYCHDHKKRRLGEVEDVPHHRLLEVAEREQGDLAGVISSKDGMLPDSVADSLRAHLEGLYDAEDFPPVNSLPKTGRNMARNDVYTVKINGPELISLIGKDNTRGLLDYFHQSLGHEVPVTGIELQVVKNGDVGQSFNHHKDKTATLLVFLNDMDAGGEVDYLTTEGHLKIPAKKGRAVAHGPNTIHGAKMWYGDRSLFYLQSSGSLSDDCMLKDLLD